MRSDIIRGGRFPDYELPDQDGHPRRLSELQAGQPMVLVLTRGHFCPKDHQQHREIVELLPRIDVAYTSVVTITTDESAGCWDMKKATGATWPFCLIPPAPCNRICASPSSGTRTTTRWCPTRSCSPRSWSSTRCIAATGSGADRRAMTSGAISARCYRAPGRTSIPRSANEPTTCTIEDALGVAIVYRAALNSPDLIHGATFPGPRAARSRRTCPASE